MFVEEETDFSDYVFGTRFHTFPAGFASYACGGDKFCLKISISHNFNL
jgi:hypothetical protein